ncbi:Xaa-Pro aminopeptidase [hydrothermal vent metagenome]|uniref:Xaa-Pro aminopeptidase n=1 Tax=hydrothermal vent metagenome TaxID=652676 RepID=A0A3B0RUS1_9ZZZZ
MYQSFKDTSQRKHSANRVSALRTELEKQNLDGFIIPHADEFQGEYLPAYAERLAWLTGFTGSAGSAIVLADKAAIFVDGRYTIQVAEQIDDTVISALDSAKTAPDKWLAKNLKSDQRLGFDPWLLTASQTEKFKKAAHTAGAELVSLVQNPIDTIWHDQPEKPSKPLFAHPLQFAGKTTADKIAQIQKTLKEKDADAAVLSRTDSVSWLFNIRGNEITHNPVVLSYAIVKAKGKAQLFVDRAKVPEGVASLLAQTTDIQAPGQFASALGDLGKANAHVLLDKTTAPEQIRAILHDARASIITRADPCVLPKAIKNDVELSGARAAHLRDGAVMARFLCWLDREAPKGNLDEISVAEKLEALRVETGVLEEISFDTISAAGPHAAIPHYRVTTASNQPLRQNQVFLCDSGAQYRDGTTDITRTVIVGKPTDEMRDCYTRVLKGMIGLTMVRFPVGTNGAQLDTLARQHLWSAGLDFDHGTGHGVGSYLCVHEGPASISKAGNVALQPGMILSNEPGYYQEGDFGIRIENLIIVTPARKIKGGNRKMLGFETLTLTPIDQRLINRDLLTETEKQWLNAYHQKVFDEISPQLDATTTKWLKSVTGKVGAGYSTTNL